MKFHFFFTTFAFIPLEFIYQKPFMSSNHFRLDESIIPYYGRYGTKQLVRGKPIRFGFKIWCLCFLDGYFIHAEIYCRSDTDIEETKLRQETDILLGLVEKCKMERESTVTIDNLFTSLPLLDKLTEMGINGLGTIREN